MCVDLFAPTVLSAASLRHRRWRWRERERGRFQRRSGYRRRGDALFVLELNRGQPVRVRKVDYSGDGSVGGAVARRDRADRIKLAAPCFGRSPRLHAIMRVDYR